MTTTALIGPGWLTTDYRAGSYRSRNGPASAPTADPTQPAGTYNGQPKYLNPTDGTGTVSRPSPGGGTSATPPLSSDPLTMLGQLYAAGFGNGAGLGGAPPLAQTVAPPIQAAAPTSTPWSAIIVVALIAGGAYYWYKHRKGASA